eukprot:5066317-Karenia_brevis.AAC.1
MGRYTSGPCQNQRCAVKWFKNGDVFEERFFQKDLQAVQRAADFINAFNGILRMKSPSRPYRIHLNEPGVWTDISTEAKKRL